MESETAACLVVITFPFANCLLLYLWVFLFSSEIKVVVKGFGRLDRQRGGGETDGRLRDVAAREQEG